MIKYIRIFLVLVLLSVTSGCVGQSGSTHPTLSQGAETLNIQTNNTSVRIITDMGGVMVTIPHDPQRVAVFSGPVAQIPYILGVQNRIIATTPAMKQSQLLRQIDPGIVNLTDVRGATGEIDYELLRIAGADMVLSPPLDSQLIRKRTTIPAVIVTSSQGDSFDQIVRQIRFVGDLFNRTDKADRYEEFLHETLSLVSERTRSIPPDNRLVVFCGYDQSHMMTYGNDTFLEERISIAGCKNAALLGSPAESAGKITPSQSEVTLELILSWNPDVIIIDSGSPDDIYNDKRWAPINAVRNHRVYLQPQGIFKWSRPNAESAVFYPVWLAKTIYPDRFSGIQISDLLRRYFNEFFQYQLTDEQVTAILNGSYGSINKD